MIEKKINFRTEGILFLSTILIRILIIFLAGWVSQKIKVDIMLLQFVSQLIYVIPSIVFAVNCKGYRKEIFHIKSVRVPTFLLLIAITVLSMPILATANAFSMLFTENVANSLFSELIPNYSYGIMIGVIAFTPALLEEFVYRGALLGGYEKGGLWKAVVLSSFMFGLMHMNLNQLMYATILGIIMAVTVEITGSIFSSILIHITLNGISITLGYFMFTNGRNLQYMTDTVASSKVVLIVAMLIYAYISIFALAGIIALLWMIARLEKRVLIFQRLNPFCKTVFSDQSDQMPIERSSVLSIPLILGVLISVGLIVWIG